MIRYFDGDLIKSHCDIICHQVNCQGVMGAGIAKQIKEIYPDVFNWYRDVYNAKGNKLGNIDFVHTYSEKFIENIETLHTPADRFVVNMYSQDNYLPREVCNTDYNAFRECCKKIKLKLKEVAKIFGKKESDYIIGFPYNIGCGLAGGDWNKVKKILEEEFSENKYKVEIWKL